MRKEEVIENLILKKCPTFSDTISFTNQANNKTLTEEDIFCLYYLEDTNNVEDEDIAILKVDGEKYKIAAKCIDFAKAVEKPLKPEIEAEEEN